MTIAEALRSERAIARLTQRQVAEAVGVAPVTIHYWESDRHPAEPRFSDLVKISKVWRKPLNEWLPDVVQAEGER